MALQLTINSRYSADPIEAYLRITDVQANFTFQVARIEISVYEDKKARDADKQPIDKYLLNLTPVDPPTFAEVLASLKTTKDTPEGTLVFDMVKAGLYTLLKTKPEYKDAIDV